MSKILIETYRGFDIEFDTECEKFQCICTEEEAKESKSFAAVKGFVDEYKKANQEFKPFWIELKPDSYSNSSKTLKVIGIRKDERFVVEKPDGTKQQLSDWDLDKYMLKKECNDEPMRKFQALEEAYEIYRKKYVQDKNDVITSMNIETLKEYKKTLIN